MISKDLFLIDVNTKVYSLVACHLEYTMPKFKVVLFLVLILMLTLFDTDVNVNADADADDDANVDANADY